MSNLGEANIVDDPLMAHSCSNTLGICLQCFSPQRISTINREINKVNNLNTFQIIGWQA